MKNKTKHRITRFGTNEPKDKCIKRKNVDKLLRRSYKLLLNSTAARKLQSSGPWLT